MIFHIWRNQVVQVKFRVVLLKSVFFMRFLLIFAIANHLPGFSTIGLPNGEDFRNANIINVSIINYYCQTYLCMLLKTQFLLLYLLNNGELDFILFTWFHNTKQLPEIFCFKVEIRNAIWVSKFDEYRNYWVLINSS